MDLKPHGGNLLNKIALRMRTILILLLFISGYTLHAQNNAVDGRYYLKWECESHQIEYKLSLRKDGTYNLDTYTRELAWNSDVVNKSEEGNWREKDGTITFSSKADKDFDEEYTVDLNGSIARFVTTTSSDGSGQKSKTTLIFDTSKIYCIEGMEFIKME